MGGAKCQYQPAAMLYSMCIGCEIFIVWKNRAKVLFALFNKANANSPLYENLRENTV